MGNYITIKQACEYYNVTRKTIYNWRNSGAIKEKNKGGTVLLDVDSIEAMITRKLPNQPNQDLRELTQEVQKLNAKIDQLEALINRHYKKRPQAIMRKFIDLCLNFASFVLSALTQHRKKDVM